LHPRDEQDLGTTQALLSWEGDWAIETRRIWLFLARVVAREKKPSLSYIGQSIRLAGASEFSTQSGFRIETLQWKTNPRVRCPGCEFGSVAERNRKKGRKELLLMGD
jgi:hypothetical protein